MRISDTEHAYNPWKARLAWCERGADDARYLALWRDAPLTYTPGQRHEGMWKYDHHALTLGPDPDGRLFAVASELLFRYHFYPPAVMASVSDFSLEGRAMRPGDRVVIRIRLLALPGLPLLDVLAMNEISTVLRESDYSRMSYVTTAAHAEVGEWAAAVRRDAMTGDVSVMIDSVSRTVEPINEGQRLLARRLQLRAHRLGMAHFRSAVLARTGRGIPGVPGDISTQQA